MSGNSHSLQNGIGILINAVFEFWHFSSPVDFFPVIAIAIFGYKTYRFFAVSNRIAFELETAIAFAHLDRTPQSHLGAR